jgi:hypothetical protein
MLASPVGRMPLQCSSASKCPQYQQFSRVCDDHLVACAKSTILLAEPTAARAHVLPVRQLFTREEMIMRSMLAAILALAVLAGAAGLALAVDEDFPRDFWEQQKRNLP